METTRRGFFGALAVAAVARRAGPAPIRIFVEPLNPDEAHRLAHEVVRFLPTPVDGEAALFAAKRRAWAARAALIELKLQPDTTPVTLKDGL